MASTDILHDTARAHSRTPHMDQYITLRTSEGSHPSPGDIPRQHPPGQTGALMTPM